MHARSHVLLAALCFGTTGTAQALGPGGLAPAGVGAARVVIGGALLVAVALAGRAPLSRLRPGPLLVGAGGVAAYQLCFFAAVADTGAEPMATIVPTATPVSATAAKKHSW